VQARITHQHGGIAHDLVSRRLRWWLVLGAIACGAFIALFAPRVASARWTRVSSTPTGSEPYFVCSGHARRARCDVIEDPTRGADARGPVAAGAITSGPEQQVSPALFGNGKEGGYSPDELRGAYNLPSTSAGSGQTVAIVDAFDDPNAESDLKKYRAQYGIAECTAASGCFRKVDESGGTSYPEASVEWSPEISLDLDMVSAICPNCHILLVEASNEFSSSFANGEDEAAKLGATEISNSFGGETPSEPPEFAAAYDHPGIPITAAAGDHGFIVESPASNPHVIAVGGTTLVPAKNSRGWSETVWFEHEGAGTGSGCSEEPKPAWQADAGCPFRTNNDVAAVADPNTPVSVYDSYQSEGRSSWRLLGGTSVATPIVAASMALSNPYTRTLEGAKSLYLEADGLQGAGLLNDIVSGSNGSCGNYLCQAEKGYDGPTGVGSLDGPPEVPPPTAATDAAGSVGQTEARLSGTVDPNGGEVSECKFEYGPTASYGKSVPCSSGPGSGIDPVTVSATATELAAGSEFHYRLAISYPSGGAHGGDLAFTTLEVVEPPQSPPSVQAEGPTAITETSVTLTAKVDPNGAQVDECVFEYGTTASYGSNAPCTPSPGGGQEPVTVSAAISGLAASATYHFRVLANNAGGTSSSKDRFFETGSSKDRSFETLPEPSPTVSEEPPAQAQPPTIGASSKASVSPPLVSPIGGAQEPQAARSPSAPAAVVAVELARASFAVGSGGALVVPMRCPGVEQRCTGTITLRTLGAVTIGIAAHRAARRVLTLASSSFAIGGGRVLAVKLRLSSSARVLLARLRVLHARATIVARNGIGVADTTDRTVTIRALHGKG
jgi:hypothetical protein